MQFCAHKLDKKDFFGKSDPFLTFYRANEDNRYFYFIRAASGENLFFGFPISYDTNQTVTLQKIALGLKFQL